MERISVIASTIRPVSSANVVRPSTTIGLGLELLQKMPTNASVYYMTFFLSFNCLSVVINSCFTTNKLGLKTLNINQTKCKII